MNPLTKEDVINKTDNLLNPNFLISTSYDTHQAIHFGNDDMTPMAMLKCVERKPGDTCPWK